MFINPLIFRAYDIRGIADKDLTPENMLLIGKACGTYWQRYYGKKVAIGRDNRLSGEALHKAFIEGAASTGCQIMDIGLATSPMIYYAVCKYNLDGGANITASHNPKEYNGIKLVGKNAHSICGEELQNIYKIINEENIFTEGKGMIKEKNVFPDYLNDLQRNYKTNKPLKVVVDAGNGVAGIFAPQLLKNLEHEVVELYCIPDGNFPHHPANPEEEKNMTDLIKKVQETKADLGIGFDGDGDRIGVVDENGKFYSADYLIILLARDLLERNPGAKIVFDVKCSLVLEEEIKKCGGVPLMSKTGHSFIEKRMKEENAPLAGEASGHLFFGENYYGFDDAILAAVKILDIVSRSGKPLSEHFTDVPKTYLTPEFKASCPDDKKFIINDQIRDFFKEKYPCITLDGVRIVFDEDSWGLVRCSNTTPNLTLRFEAKTEERLKEIIKIMADKMQEFPEVDMGWYRGKA